MKFLRSKLSCNSSPKDRHDLRTPELPRKSPAFYVTSRCTIVNLLTLNLIIHTHYNYLRVSVLTAGNKESAIHLDSPAPVSIKRPRSSRTVAKSRNLIISPRRSQSFETEYSLSLKYLPPLKTQELSSRGTRVQWRGRIQLSLNREREPGEKGSTRSGPLALFLVGVSSN